jgi:hypothetical protein
MHVSALWLRAPAAAVIVENCLTTGQLLRLQVAGKDVIPVVLKRDQVDRGHRAGNSKWKPVYFQ